MPSKKGKLNIQGTAVFNIGLLDHPPYQSTEADYKSIPIHGMEGNVYLTTHSTHFIYSYMASDIW